MRILINNGKVKFGYKGFSGRFLSEAFLKMLGNIKQLFRSFQVENDTIFNLQTPEKSFVR